MNAGEKRLASEKNESTRSREDETLEAGSRRQDRYAGRISQAININWVVRLLLLKMPSGGTTRLALCLALVPAVEASLGVMERAAGRQYPVVYRFEVRECYVKVVYRYLPAVIAG